MPDSQDASTPKQLDKGQLATVEVATAPSQRFQQAMYTPQQHARSISVQKRRLSPVGSDLLLPEKRSRQQRGTQRDLFREDKEQAHSLLAPPPADFSRMSSPRQLHASAQLAKSPLGEANTEHSPQSAMSQGPLVIPSKASPLTASWSLLQSHSAQVLQARLGRCDLLPENTATGRQLLEMEVQLQSLVGARTPVDDADEVCWVDNGLLMYPEGVKCFAISHGDAECAQVAVHYLAPNYPNTACLPLLVNV